jgi:hypothetical protein
MRIKARAWEFGILGALVVLYLVFLSLYFVPVADNVDANGYIGSARIFKEHGRFFQVPPDDYAFIGRMWVANSRGEYYPKYPPLYPALAGLMMMGFGVDAGFYVAPGCALLAVLGMYVLCRTQFSGPLSLLGAAALAANPVFNTFALRQMSHAPGMCLLVWAYAVFFLAPRKEAGRFRPALVFAAGLLLGCSVGIRYTNMLLVIPPLFLILSKKDGRRFRIAAAYLAGLAVPCVLLAGYHWRAFGGPFTTGYALTGEQTGFGWEYLASKTLRYGTSLLTNLGGPVFILSGIGLVMLWLKNRTRAIFFSIWVFPISLLYMSYYWETGLFPGAFLRFLLPAVIPGVLLALGCLNEILQRTRSRRAMEAVVIIVFAGSLGWWGVRGTLSRVEKEYVDRVAKKTTVDFIKDTVPEGSVVFAHPVLLLALDVNQTYTLYPHVILDKNRVRVSVMDPDRRFGLALQESRVDLLEKALCNVDNRTYLSRIQSLIDTALSEGREVFVAGDPGIITKSVWSLPVCFASEPVAEQKWMIPAHKLLSRDKPATGGGEKTVRPKEIAFEIVRITRALAPDTR